jgi:Fe-S cluster biogenesis protein NfuA
VATHEGQAFQARLAQLDALVQTIDTFADPAARASAREIIQTLMELHGAGLERILDITAADGIPGAAIIDRLARDELVGSLLLLYGLHPLDLETRVRQALDRARPMLQSHGGNVEILDITAEGLVRLRLQGSCHGCPSSAMTLRNTIEEQIYAAAPDVVAIDVEGLAESPAKAPHGVIPLELVM